MENVIEFPLNKKAHDENYSHLKSRRDYFLEMIARYNKENEESTESLFSGMSNGLHNKHSKEIRERFLAFYNAPSPETWKEIRNYLIDATTTSWQLWTKYDLNAPRSISNKKEENMFPDIDSFLEYYKFHKNDRINEYSDRLKKIEEELKEYR